MDNNFKFWGGQKKIESSTNVNLEAENKKLIEENNKLKLEISALQRSAEKGNNLGFELYKENAIFAPELKPYAEKVLSSFEIGHKLQLECTKLYEKEINNTNATALLNKAFAKFSNATSYLKIGDLREQLNNIIYNNGILIKPPTGKENNHSFIYATIRQAIRENRSEENRIKSFEKNISIGLINRYFGALLVLVEDMKILTHNSISIPKEIEQFGEKLRSQITKELGLKISDIKLLEKLNNNNYINVMDEVTSPLTNESERVVEVLFYGVGGYGGHPVDNTKVIISK